MTPVQKEFRIICEGYNDRAFWSEMLITRRWNEAFDKSTKRTAHDPRGLAVTGGRYAFYHPDSAYAEVIPAGGESNIIPIAEKHLMDITGYVQQSVSHTESKYVVVLSVDDDTTTESGATLPTLSVQHVTSVLESVDSQLVVENGVFYLFSRNCAVHITRWKADPLPKKGVPVRGVPAKQTLERLVCAAICEAYDTRSEDVETWLREKSRSPKAYAWSYMAGWYAEHGCDDFYREIWRDDDVRPILERQLKAIGAWAIIDTLSHPSA